MSIRVATQDIALPSAAGPNRLPRWLRLGLGAALALVGAVAIYLWVVRGGLILFDVSTVFCL